MSLKVTVEADGVASLEDWAILRNHFSKQWAETWLRSSEAPALKTNIRDIYKNEQGQLCFEIEE